MQCEKTKNFHTFFGGLSHYDSLSNTISNTHTHTDIDAHIHTHTHTHSHIYYFNVKNMDNSLTSLAQRRRLLWSAGTTCGGVLAAKKKCVIRMLNYSKASFSTHHPML